jgi:hypothetical protein
MTPEMLSAAITQMMMACRQNLRQVVGTPRLLHHALDGEENDRAADVSTVVTPKTSLRAKRNNPDLMTIVAEPGLLRSARNDDKGHPLQRVIDWRSRRETAPDIVKLIWP